MSYQNQRTNEWVLEKVGEKRHLLKNFKKIKLTYFGQIWQSTELEKTIMEGRVDGSGRKGSQKSQWIDNIKKWMHVDAKEVGELAKNQLGFPHRIIHALESAWYLSKTPSSLLTTWGHINISITHSHIDSKVGQLKSYAYWPVAWPSSLHDHS